MEGEVKVICYYAGYADKHVMCMVKLKCMPDMGINMLCVRCS